MDGYDFLNFVTWLQDTNRKPAIYAFTAGEARDAASAVEQSGVLTRLAVLGKVEEMLRKRVNHELRVGYTGDGTDYRDPMGDFYAVLENIDTEESEEVQHHTILDALAALVDGKEGG